MKLKVFIDVRLQPERFNILMENTKKYKILNKYNIEIIDNFENSDLILFLINSRSNLDNLSSEYQYIFNTEIPIILLERVDSALTWARNLDKIKNLLGVFKNRKLRNVELQNSDNTYYGKYQFYFIHKDYKINNLIYDKGTDIGIELYPKQTKLKELSKENIKKIMCVLWDFHSSPLCQKLSMNHFRSNEINFRKTIDVFCVNQVKTNNFVNIPRIKAKKIVESLNNYKTITNNLKPNEYEKVFAQSKIAVACWGFGEWVHMDAYALYAGAILIKPDCSHVRMYPDIYQSNKTYIPCRHDYSDLKEIIIDVLENYNKYIPKIIKNRKFLLELDEKKACDIFWEKVIELSKN